MFNVIVLITLLLTSYAKVYDRCSLAKDLLHVYHIPSEQIPTWICIASHGSQLDTRFNNKESAAHGLFQIPRNVWCGNLTSGCNLPCSKFRDDDIEDDVNCIKKIYKNSGFGGWNSYYQYCKGDQEQYIKDCHF